MRLVQLIVQKGWRVVQFGLRHAPRVLLWLILLPFVIGRFLVRFLFLPKVSVDAVRCLRCGRMNSLLRRWRCPCCKAIETTHAWARCSFCGTTHVCGYIYCENPRCRESIPNPHIAGWP